jgi:hypothetical protein
MVVIQFVGSFFKPIPEMPCYNLEVLMYRMNWWFDYGVLALLSHYVDGRGNEHRTLELFINNADFSSILEGSKLVWRREEEVGKDKKQICVVYEHPEIGVVAELLEMKGGFKNYYSWKKLLIFPYQPIFIRKIFSEKSKFGTYERITFECVAIPMYIQLDEALKKIQEYFRELEEIKSKIQMLKQRY